MNVYNSVYWAIALAELGKLCNDASLKALNLANQWMMFLQATYDYEDALFSICWMNYRRDRIMTRAGGEIYSPAPMSYKSSATVQFK